MEDLINTLDTTQTKFTKIKLYLGKKQSCKHFNKNVNNDFYKKFLDKISLEKSAQFEKNNTYIYEDLMYNINKSECNKMIDYQIKMNDKYLIYFINERKCDVIKFPCKTKYNQIKTNDVCMFKFKNFNIYFLDGTIYFEINNNAYIIDTLKHIDNLLIGFNY
jgi:hypothetical protein